MFKHNHFNQNNNRGRHFQLSYVLGMSEVRVPLYVIFACNIV